MQRTDVLIIGAGQAGLAISACLAARGIAHALLERGRIAERWRTERRGSLRLLTPNWMTRLPGHPYAGPDPDGFMTAGEVAGFLDAYAAAAPVVTGTPVLHVAPTAGGYTVATDAGSWHARAVVVATGACDRPAIPAWAAALPAGMVQLAPAAYRRPADLPEGGVLVVGASATGVQLAEELAATGRAVTLAVGRHQRVPRRYRGRDIMAWMADTGILDDRVPARRQPSLQLAGRADPPDLGRLQPMGVRLTGRVLGADGPQLTLGATLVQDMVESEDRLKKVLARIDAHIRATGAEAPEEPDAHRAPPVPAARETLDLRAAGIRSVIWATGYRRRYPWLHVPVLGLDGEIAHAGGVTAAPGLFALGLPFLRRRSSTFIDGCGRDAAELAPLVAAHLGRRPARAA